jgi:hypothetical protein
MPNKNQPLKFQQENTKRRKRRMKIALIVGALVVSVGGGIGIAYAIWYTKYANNNDNVLDIKNASDLKANVGRFCATESLTCTTKTGKSVNDAIYSARDLPEGFSIDSKSGVVGGVPKTEGSYNYTIQVTSDAHPTANGKISKKLDVGPAQAQSLTISGAEALNGTVNADFSKTLTLSCKDDLGDEITGVNYTIEGLPVGLT